MADTYPRYYFAGRRGIPGDVDFIMGAMERIPDKHKDQVSTNYEHIFRKVGRREANWYLEQCLKWQQPYPRKGRMQETFFEFVTGQTT